MSAVQTRRSGGGSAAGGLSAPVANSDLANMANATVKGRVTSGTGVPEDVTMAQLWTLLGAVTPSVDGGGF